MGRAVDFDLDFSVDLPDGADRGAIDEGRTVVAGKAAMGGVGPRGHRDARSLLIERRHVLAQTPLRPAPHHLGSVELLEGDRGSFHRAPIILEADRGVGRGEIQPTGPEDELLAGVDLDLLPSLVGSLGQLDVGGGVIGQPDDPAVIL